MTTRAERRRHDRAKTRPAEEHHGTVAAWCATEADLPETRQRTHDILVRLMGPARRGAVSWRWWSGRDATEVLELLSADATGEHADYYQRIAEHLRDQGGFLVLASAPAVAGAARANPSKNFAPRASYKPGIPSSSLGEGA